MEQQLTPSSSAEIFLAQAMGENLTVGKIQQLSSVTTNAGFGFSDTKLNACLRDYWPSAYSYWCNHPDKFQQAFKIVQKLMEKKIVKKIVTIEDFVNLINEVQNIL